MEDALLAGLVNRGCRRLFPVESTTPIVQCEGTDCHTGNICQLFLHSAEY